MSDPFYEVDEDQEEVHETSADEAEVDMNHFVDEPTEADYEKARTVGIGNEPELPPGKVDNGSRVRGREGQ